MALTWDIFHKEQPLAAALIQNSLKKDRMAHAYLFEGPHGTGKKEAGLLIAKSLFCESPDDSYVPCETCINCKRAEHGNHPDIHLVEPDGLSIKIDQIRSLRKEFSKAGVESKKKLYLITNAEKMTVSAANSLLKFLEEPNSDTTAILMTEQIQQILPTILSRCQTVPFKALPAEKVSERLVEAGVNEGKAFLLASLTNNIKEALELNTDDWFAQARKIVLKLYEALKQNPLYAMTALQEDWFGHFKEKNQLDQGLDLLLLVYKDLLYIQLGKNRQLAYPEQRQQFEKDALHTSLRKLSEQMTAILEAKRKLHANMNPQLLMEQLVLNLQGGSTFV